MKTDTTETGEQAAVRNLPFPAAIPPLHFQPNCTREKDTEHFKFTWVEKHFKDLKGGSNPIQTSLLFHMNLLAMVPQLCSHLCGVTDEGSVLSQTGEKTNEGSTL